MEENKVPEQQTDPLKDRLLEVYPEAVFDKSGPWLCMQVEVSVWKELAGKLRHDPALTFDYLFCLSGVDWKTHLMVVYHLRSQDFGHTLVVKVKVDRENARINTVSDIWRTAEFHELEAYDLFGILFEGHPGLRRLFLTDDWQGWPLRKDYTDEVNMIKL